MTNKTLSEQICEVCGIKKKRIILYDCKGCKYLIDNECKRGDNPCKPPYKYVYPDFENINFVRFFNLNYIEHADATIAQFVLFRYRNITNTHSFLGCILFELQHGNYKEVEQIKQAIRQADWEV